MTHYYTTVEEDENGELYIMLPDALLESSGWKEGDVIALTVEDNSIVLQKDNK